MPIDSPILLSPHNPHTLYYGGNHVFRSLDRGEHWERISPDLTRNIDRIGHVPLVPVPGRPEPPATEDCER